MDQRPAFFNLLHNVRCIYGNMYTQPCDHVEADTRMPDCLYSGVKVTHALSSLTSTSLHTCQYSSDIKDEEERTVGQVNHKGPPLSYHS